MHSLLRIPCKISDVSDGVCTFGELYHARNLLFILLAKSNAKSAWYSFRSHDGIVTPGYLIIGIELPPTGIIAYQIGVEYQTLIAAAGITQYPRAKEFKPMTTRWIADLLTLWISTQNTQ